MNREMHKKDTQLTMEATKELLVKGHHGTLSVNGDDGYPYAVPVNYVYLNDAVYIHSAKYGYKIEALEKNDKVCFSAIISSNVLPSHFTAEFESVIAFGKAELVADDAEKQEVLETFITRFAPGREEAGAKMIKGNFPHTAIIKVNIESMTGKAWGLEK